MGLADGYFGTAFGFALRKIPELRRLGQLRGAQVALPCVIEDHLSQRDDLKSPKERRGVAKLDIQRFTEALTLTHLAKSRNARARAELRPQHAHLKSARLCGLINR